MSGYLDAPLFQDPLPARLDPTEIPPPNQMISNAKLASRSEKTRRNEMQLAIKSTKPAHPYNCPFRNSGRTLGSIQQ